MLKKYIKTPKRILSLLLTLIIALAFTNGIGTPPARAVSVNDFTELQAAIADFNSGSADVTITVTGDISIEFALVVDGSSSTLTITSDGTIRTLYRQCADVLFEVNGGASLVLNNIIVDGRKDTYSTNVSSLVWVYSGTFTLNSGAVLRNNRSSNGGAVSNLQGTFILNGGEISGNIATNAGGGVYVNVSSPGLFNMSSGSIISGNTAAYGGGVYFEGGSFFNMAGGEISNNSSSVQGGGLVITITSAVTLNLGGTAVIKNNTQSGTASNVHLLPSNNFINLETGAGWIPAPSPGMEIWVQTQTPSGVIVNFGANATHAQYFHSDDPTMQVVHESGQLLIVPLSPPHTVTYNKNNTDAGSTEASPQTQTVTPPATTVGTLPTPPDRPGYTFNGWNTQPGGGGTAFTATTPVTASLTVHAQWTASPTTHTVTYDKNNTDAGATEASPQTQTVTPPATTVGALPTPPDRPGYTFNGWNTQPGGGGTAFTATTPVTASLTVHAQWTTAPTAPQIQMQALPSGRTVDPYSYTFQATGTTPITWAVEPSAASLPPGLTLNTSTGVISGTPTAEGTSNFTIRATNAIGNDSRAFSILIDNSTGQGSTLPTNIIIAPANPSVQKGTTRQFSASATINAGTVNLPHNVITWSVNGGGIGTSISSSGLLTVGADELATTLTVRAAYQPDPTIFGTTNVTVTPGIQTPSQNWSLHPASFSFQNAPEGYGMQPAESIVINNPGPGSLTAVRASVTPNLEDYYGSGTGYWSGYWSGSSMPPYFELIQGPASTVPAGGFATIEIRPRTGLPTGTYSGELTVTTAESGSRTIPLSFTVGGRDLVIIEHVGEMIVNRWIKEDFFDEVFIIEGGNLNEFVDFYFNGVLLTRNVDYRVEQGSVKIVVYSRTFERFGEGTHTINARFNIEGQAKSVEQTFTLRRNTNDNPSDRPVFTPLPPPQQPQATYTPPQQYPYVPYVPQAPAQQDGGFIGTAYTMDDVGLPDASGQNGSGSGRQDFGTVPQTSVPDLIGAYAAFCIALAISIASWGCIVIRKRKNRPHLKE